MMTLIIAFRCRDNGNEKILISSDSTVTAGYVTFETRKIHPIKYEDVSLAVAAGSGDSSLIKQSYRISEKILYDFYVNKWDRNQPTFDQFEIAVNAIESNLIRRFRDIKNQGIEIKFRMIVGNVDNDEKASLYLFDHRGLVQPVHDNPGYSIIGMGSITGGYLLLNMLGCEPEIINATEATSLATFIIDAVSEIDPSVGSFVGECYLMRKEEDMIYLTDLKEEYIRIAKDESLKKKEIIRRLWSCCDYLDLDLVLGLIDELEKKVYPPKAEEEEEE